MQTKRQSLIETLVGNAIAFSISTALAMLIVPWIFGTKANLGQGILMTVIYTFVSIVRSYYVRRFFNWYFK